MARGSIVKRQSGDYAIVYYVGGKQKWETIGPSRRKAERALTARKREVDTGAWPEPSSETLREYATRWLDRRNPAGASAGRTRLAPSTYEGYQVNLRLHVLLRLGERTLGSLRTEDVDELIVALEVDGKAPATVRNVVVPLRKMLADAVRLGLIVANPAARADLPPAKDFAGKRSRTRTQTQSGLRSSTSLRPTRSETSRIAITSISSTSPSAPASAEVSCSRSGSATSTAIAA
jgi:hypothetical protein